MKTRGFVGLATAIAGLALAGWILSVAPDAVAQAGGSNDGKAAGQVEAAAAQAQGDAQDSVAAIKARIVLDQKKHLRNLVRINRILEIAEDGGQVDLRARADTLRVKEYKRHQRVIDHLQRQRRAALGDPGLEKKPAAN